MKRSGVVIAKTVWYVETQNERPTGERRARTQSNPLEMPVLRREEAVGDGDGGGDREGD